MILSITIDVIFLIALLFVTVKLMRKISAYRIESIEFDGILSKRIDAVIDEQKVLYNMFTYEPVLTDPLNDDKIIEFKEER